MKENKKIGGYETIVESLGMKKEDGNVIYKGRIYDDKNDILEIWGSGTEKRDFLHIDDFLNGINLIILKQKKNFEIFNLSYGKSFPLKKIIEKILVISKNKKKLKYFKNKPTIKINILVSNKKILNKIGWKPKTTIDEGILKAINWYKSFY